MAEKQIPGGAYLLEPAASKQAQVPGAQYVNVVVAAETTPIVVLASNYYF